MNGIYHYQKAEELLELAAKATVDSGIERSLHRAAQVHATLALAAATALSGVISNNVSPGAAINDLAHDSETVEAVNNWHEIATRGMN